MSAIRIISLTLYGQDISDQLITIGAGATITWDLALKDPDDIETPVDLSGCAVQMTLCTLDAGNTTEPPIISRQADITGDPTEGNCTVSWVSGDTVVLGVPLTAGFYGLDVWTTDEDGNRLQNMGLGKIRLTPVATLPATEVTPLPAQAPIGLGPNLGHAANFATLPSAALKAWLFYETDDDGLVYYSNGVAWVVVSGGSSGDVINHVATAGDLPDSSGVPWTFYATDDTGYVWYSNGPQWTRVGPPPITQFSQAFSALPDPSVFYGQAYKVFSNNAVYESAFNVWRQIGALAKSTVKTSDYTAEANQRVAVDLSGGSFNVTLPKATTCPAATVVVKKTVDSTNTLTILPNATLPDTVEGGSSFGITGGGKQSVTLYSDGVSNWEII